MIAEDADILGLVNNHFSRARNELLTSDAASPTLPSVGLTDQLETLIRASTSDATRRAYQCNLKHFLAWGGSIPATPETLANYLAYFAPTQAVATVARRIVSIGKAHTTQGFANPASSELVRRVLKGIRRTYGKPQKRVAAAVRSDILLMCSGLGSPLKDLRDKAILLVGFTGAFRRSELVSLMVSDVEFASEGMVITLQRSKTDQDGAGRKIAIPFGRGKVCAVIALREWLEAAGIADGPIFRPVSRHSHLGAQALTGETVSSVVKERATAAGLDATKYAGHSLRAGLATSAAAAGVPSYAIRKQTGHKSDAMLARYIRDGELFQDNAAGAIL